MHSFAPVPADERDVLGTAEYGAPFVSAVQRGCFYGVQFHPEKSSAAGLRLLANFARICIAAGVAVTRGLPSLARVRLYPAIDILGGNAVRLVKGDFDAKKVYDEDPLSAAAGWVEAGAGTCTSSTSTARSAANRSTSRGWDRSRPKRVCRCNTVAGCARRGPSRKRSTPALRV